MKLWRKYAALAAALVLCLTLAACGGDDGGSDDNFYNVPESFEGLVKDSEQMADLYVYGGAWRGEDGSTLIAAHNESGDEVRFALYDADEEITASGFIQHVPEYDDDYFYNEHDGVAYRARFDAVGALHVTSLGTFEKMLGDTPGRTSATPAMRRWRAYGTWTARPARPAFWRSTRMAAGRCMSVPAVTATPPWWTAARWRRTRRIWIGISPFPTSLTTWSTTSTSSTTA